jgi:hypothetical protein
VKLLKTKREEAPALTPEQSLRDQLEAAVAAAEKYVAQIAQKEKDASPLQPLPMARNEFAPYSRPGFRALRIGAVIERAIRWMKPTAKSRKRY